MKRTHFAVASAAILGILALVTVARGIGGGVAAAEDDRFRINGTTLTKYLGTDTFVSIPDTVTTISDEAFSGNETLTSIEIPDSVTTIAYNAFKNCTALTSVIIPDSVTKIGPGAFEGCTALTSVEIGENVSSWGTGVFTNCDSLAKVSIDSDNEYLTYYNGAIYNGNMTMLYQVLPARDGENYAMPDTVKDIDAYAFWNLKNTKNVKVSSAVGSIPKYAMTNMGTVENVVIQNATSAIGEKAFANNAALKQVAVPSSVTNIDKKAFTGSPDVKLFTTKSSAADTFGKDIKIEVVYESAYPTDFMDSNAGLEEKPNVGENRNENAGNGNEVTTVADAPVQTTEQNVSEETVVDEEPQSEPGSNSGYIHPLDVPESDDVIGKTVIVAGQAVVLSNNREEKVYGIPDGVHAEIEAEEQSETAESESQGASDESNVNNSISVSYTKEESKETDEQNNETIPQRKFYKQKSLTNYDISETINSIGRLAFAESGLKKIEIPKSVMEIEYGAFMSCTDLVDVAIPDTVSSIGTKAFEGTPWLKNWMAGESGSEDGDFLIVGDGILLAYRGNQAHVEIPDGVKQIGSEVFKEHTEIVDVAVPASVTKICAEAFRNCSSLTGLTGCKGLKTVIRGAFYGTQISETDFAE